jgi:hypothetical protein
MSQLNGLQFGSGLLYATPVSGNLAANPTPLSVGVIQNVKFTLGAELKTLFGQNQWPVDSAVGKRTIKGSFEFAQMSNIFLSQLFFADAVSTGVIQTAVNEVGSIPATPFTITVANSTHFVADLGVTDALTGAPLQPVPATPTTGQYTVAAGAYVFAAADTGKAVNISYTWTNTTSGTTMVAGNHAMGFGPILALDVVFPYEGGGRGFLFPNVRLGKIDLTTKLDDYTMLTSDFEAFAGNAGSPFSSYQAY